MLKEIEIWSVGDFVLALRERDRGANDDPALAPFSKLCEELHSSQLCFDSVTSCRLKYRGIATSTAETINNPIRKAGDADNVQSTMARSAVYPHVTKI